MCEIPIEISNEEKIVRAIMCPDHLNKRGTRLRPSAFRSKPGTDEVSVIRQTHNGSDFCKAKGREIAVRSGRQYSGLAVLVAKQIRSAGSEVLDSRAAFCGHAHISHGIVQPPPNEPFPPKESMELDRRLGILRDSALYYPDPSPEIEGWSGPQL